VTSWKGSCDTPARGRPSIFQYRPSSTVKNAKVAFDKNWWVVTADLPRWNPAGRHRQTSAPSDEVLQLPDLSFGC